MAAATRARTNHQEPKPEELSAEDLEVLAVQASQPTPIGDVTQPMVAKSVYPPPQGPAYQRVETEVTIRFPGYEGFTFRMWKNHKIRMQDALWNGTWEAKCEMLRTICLSHNDWCDDQGNPLPPFSEPEQFLAECTPELYAILLDAVREEARRVPDFPMPKR